WQAVQVLHRVDPLPGEAVPALNRAMNKQLALELARKNRNTSVVVYLALIAGKIGTEDAMAPVLALARSKLSGARSVAVSALGMFNQERATRELRGFLFDTEEEVRLAAAQALAGRKDPAAIDVLVAIAGDGKSRWRGDACQALAKFPNDPR